MSETRLDDDLGSIGHALPNIECRLIDPDTGRPVGPGEPGELWVRGPNVMAGYLNDPDATRATVDADGFLHTGDLASVDDTGLFRIVGRLQELIKYKGYQVVPAEVEALLLTHPAIADAAVVGVRNADGDEVPKAFVVRQDGQPLTAADVMAFTAKNLAPHKRVRAVEFTAATPKSAAGKILRRALQDHAATEPA